MRFFMAAMLLLISFSAAHADKFSCEKWESKMESENKKPAENTTGKVGSSLV